jgi:hypothetical protein
MTGPLPQPGDRLSRVRIMPTATGKWRVRYRLNGKRRSSAAFVHRPTAKGYVARLHEQFGGAK